MQLGDELAGLADEVGFDLEALGEVTAVASLGDMGELICSL